MHLVQALPDGLVVGNLRHVELGNQVGQCTLVTAPGALELQQTGMLEDEYGQTCQCKEKISYFWTI